VVASPGLSIRLEHTDGSYAALHTSAGSEEVVLPTTAGVLLEVMMVPVTMGATY